MLEIIFTIIVCLTFFLYLAEFCLRFNRHYKAFLQLDGPGPYLPLFGNALEVIFSNSASCFRLLSENSRLYKNGYAYYSLGKLYYHIYTAENLEKITMINNTKKGFMYKFMSYFIDKGLLTAHGSKWQHRRKMITPTFHFNILKQFLNVFREESQKLVVLLNESNSASTDISEIIPRISLNIICETAMGVNIDKYPDASKFKDHIHQIGDAIQRRICMPLLHYNLLYWLLGLSRKMSKIAKPVHAFSRKLIAERRLLSSLFSQSSENIDDVDNIYMSQKPRHALLDTLFAAQRENQIDENGIQEEVDTFVFAGYDTVSAAIVHSLLVLANYREVQKTLYDHIQEALESNNSEALQIQQYTSLDYLDRVVKEVLRLYPSAPLVSRELTEELEINGVILPPGTSLLLRIYDLHRDPEQFPDPLRFDPDRFLPKNTQKRHPFAYLPFSAGSRNCIGQKYAMLELKTVLIYVISNFFLEPVTRIEDMVFVSDLILHTNHPVKMKFIPRKNNN